jgi:hypothetical protein
MIQGKIPPLENLPRILTRVCSRMIQEDEEPPLEKQHQYKNAFINITIRRKENTYSKHLSSIKTLISMSSK